MEKLITAVGDGTYRISYTPFEEGRHTIDILYDNMPIHGSPFVVNVKRGCEPKRCRAFGPGLERGVVGETNTFIVETKGAGAGALGLSIEGPSQAKMQCKDNRNGSCSVEYIPTEEGEYDFSIKFADQHIPGSPFKIIVEKDSDSSVVKAFGPGLDLEKCVAGVPTSFTIDATQSSPAQLGVNIFSDKENLTESVAVNDNGDGTYQVSYIPPAEGTPYQVEVTWKGQNIGESPFKLKALPSKLPKGVVVSGPGATGKGVPASIPTNFTINTKNAERDGDLEVSVSVSIAYSPHIR